MNQLSDVSAQLSCISCVPSACATTVTVVGVQVCLEYMVNHISPASPQFQDYLKHGEASRFSDMFVKWTDIWPKGDCSTEWTASIHVIIA